MDFSFFIPDNFTRSMNVMVTGKPKADFYKVPESYRKEIWNIIDELNNHFRKHDISISFIRNPYIDVVNFDPAVHPCVEVCAIPKTRTGKPPKYSHYVFFGAPPEEEGGHILNETFGEVYFYPSGQIGKARVIFWRDRRCFVTHFRSTKAEKLYLWRVVTHRRSDNKEIILFQNCENE